MKHAFMLLLLVAVALCCTNLTAYSQSHVVYLKDGTIVKGSIIGHVPKESITIRTNDGAVYSYQMGDINNIKRRRVRSGFSIRRTELSVLGGYGSEDMYKVGIGGRLGVVFVNGLYLGASGVYHLGTTEEAQAFGFSLSATANTFYAGPEAGYDFRMGLASVRPYVNGGYYSIMASMSGFVEGSNSEGRFYVAPGLLLQVSAGAMLFGADGRYLFVTGDNGSEVNSFIFLGSLGFSI